MQAYKEFNSVQVTAYRGKTPKLLKVIFLPQAQRNYLNGPAKVEWVSTMGVNYKNG